MQNGAPLKGCDGLNDELFIMNCFLFHCLTILGHPVTKVVWKEKNDPSGAVEYRMVSDTVNIFVNNSVVIMRVLRMGSFFFPWLLRSAFYIFCYAMTFILHYKQSIYTPFPLCYSRNRKKDQTLYLPDSRSQGCVCLVWVSLWVYIRHVKKKPKFFR